MNFEIKYCEFFFYVYFLRKFTKTTKNQRSEILQHVTKSTAKQYLSTMMTEVGTLHTLYTNPRT